MFTPKRSLVLVPLLATLSLACVDGGDPDDTMRTLPVAALTLDGDEVLVGTFDEASGELVLTPAFVSAIEAKTTSAIELALPGAEELTPLDTRTHWLEPLGVGTELALTVGDGEAATIGGVLVIEAPGWTDTLTEAEAASSFPMCFDVCEPTDC